MANTPEIAMIVDDELDLNEQESKDQELLDDLACSITKKLETRMGQRATKEAQWLRSARLYYGKLSVGDWFTKAETPFSPAYKRSRPDFNIVRSKCSVAIAQSVSMQFGTGDKNWDLWPTKDNTDPKGTEKAALMSAVIEEQLDKTRYSYQARRSMWDRVVLGTGVLKGPNSVGELVRSYTQVIGSPTWVPSLTVDYKPQLVRVNPWFFYPDDSVENVDDLADCIEVHPMSALQLKKLMKHPGFFEDQLALVLEKKPEEFLSESFKDFTQLSENGPQVYKNKYLLLEYHGPIDRCYLEMQGIDPPYDSLNDEYYGEVWVCNNKVVRVELEQLEASFRIPYYVCSWEKDPGSVFGYGVPLMMEDAQRVVTQTWHMILDNSSLSSGPQLAMQKQLIEPADNEWESRPNKIWYLTDPMASVSDAMQFFSVPNVTSNIVPILQMAQGFAEEESQIPLISAGLQSPQPADTATGQLVMQQASTTLLDFMSEDWDDNMTAPIITAYYAWNMQYNDDNEIKGGFTVDVRTSTQYKNKQLYIRDMEKLSVESANNPEMARIINTANLTRVRLSMMHLPSRDILRTEEETKQYDEQQKQANPPIDVMNLQLQSRKLALEEAQLRFDMQQQQQREAWDHEEKMTANQARLVESQARVAVSQNEKEVEILKLQQKSDEAAAKIMSQEKIATQNIETSQFNKGLEETRKQQELLYYGKEIELAQKTGHGV